MFAERTPRPPEVERPTLHLSGPRLAGALEALISGSEDHGGVERYVAALRLKSSLFAEALADGAAVNLEAETFKGLCAFIAPVRRRIGPWLDAQGFEAVGEAIAGLFDEAHDTGSTDRRVAAFCGRFPADGRHRWVRDLATELLHYADPERYPLMCRWVWDAKANTGVLREIWHGEDVDNMVIEAPDGFETFLVLREELSQFLSDNGVFRDVPFYVDLLCAQVYAGYISSQGGALLRTDFSAPDDPMRYVRRMLGLDGVAPDSGRTRLKDADGTAHVLDEAHLDGLLREGGDADS